MGVAAAPTRVDRIDWSGGARIAHTISNVRLEGVGGGVSEETNG